MKRKRIGFGATCDVYKENGRAIKKFKNDEFMLHEVGILKKLQSDYIIKMISADIMTKELTLELAEMDMFTYLKKYNSEPKDKKIIFTHIAKAVALCHSHKIAHCDIKPANMLFVDGVVKLTDFGSACPFDKFEDSETEILITMNIMAPEILYGLKFDQTIDLWALGCFLGCLALGDPIFFLGDTFDEVKQEIIDYIGTPPKRYGKMIYKKGSGFGGLQRFIDSGIDLLGKLLKYEDRLGIDEVLKHEFVIN